MHHALFFAAGLLALARCCVQFIIGLAVAIGFAAAVPKLGATHGYIRAEYSVKIPAIVIIFIISGLGLKTKALLTAAADLRIHLLIQGISLAAIPALGYAIALSLRQNGFNDHLADGLVIMACMPTTVSTNVVYTARAAGNEAAALVNAVLGNIIGIFITPLWLGHFLSVAGVAPYADVLIELTYTIIAPLIVGQLMQYCTPQVVSLPATRYLTRYVALRALVRRASCMPHNAVGCFCSSGACRCHRTVTLTSAVSWPAVRQHLTDTGRKYSSTCRLTQGPGAAQAVAGFALLFAVPASPTQALSVGDT